MLLVDIECDFMSEIFLFTFLYYFCKCLLLHGVDLTRGPPLALSSPRSSTLYFALLPHGHFSFGLIFLALPPPAPPPASLPSALSTFALAGYGPDLTSHPFAASALLSSISWSVHSIPRSRTSTVLIHPLDGYYHSSLFFARSRPAATVLSVRVEPGGK